jgi:hypothetical protein
VVQAGDTGNGCHHQTGKQLHGSDIAMVKSAGGRGKHLKHAQSAAIVAQRGNQDGAHPEAAATGQVDAGVAFGIIAEHDFAGTHGFSRDSGVGLEANPEVGRGAAGAGAADDFIAGAECDGGSGGTCKVLSPLGYCADGRLQFQLGGADFHLFDGLPVDRRGSKTGCGMRYVRQAELAAVGEGREAGTVGKIVGAIHGLGIGNGAQKVADETIELGIGDQMSGLLGEQRSPKDSGQAYQGRAATGQAVGAMVGADQLALDTKSGRLKVVP